MEKMLEKERSATKEGNHHDDDDDEVEVLCLHTVYYVTYLYHSIMNWIYHTKHLIINLKRHYD
jgi:hypothetical protein